MDFILKGPIKDSIYNIIRKIGYVFWGKDEEKGEFNFIRPLEKGGYPRFHIYLKINPKRKNIAFNLHLDQKRTIYKGSSAHSGEYDGEVVEKGIKRIKKILKQC